MEKFETLIRIFNNYATNIDVNYFEIDRGINKQIWKLWNPPYHRWTFNFSDIPKEYPMAPAKDIVYHVEYKFYDWKKMNTINIQMKEEE